MTHGRRTSSGRKSWTAVAVGAVVSGVLATAALAGEADPADGRALSLDVLRVALQSGPLDGGPALDQVEFFEARLRTRPGDPVALGRLAATHLLRYRATGDASELDRAEARLDALDAGGGPGVTHAPARVSLALARHEMGAAVTAAERGRRTAYRAGEDAELSAFDAYWAVGRYADARSLLEGMRPDRETTALLARRARLLDGLGRTEEAAEVMERVVAMVDAFAEPPVVRAWARVEAGHFLHHGGRTAEGVVRYAEALQVLPGYPAALEALGWIAYGVDGDLAAAEALFVRARTHGGHLDLLPTLAEIASARGDQGRATRYRRDFLESARRDAATERLHWRPLALTLADGVDEQDVREHSAPVVRPDARLLEEALALAERDLSQREDRGAWATRGWILHRAGRTGEAVADMERALAWGAPEPDVLHRAGMVFLEAGQTRRGVRLLRSALEGRAELGPVVAADVEARLDVF